MVQRCTGAAARRGALARLNASARFRAEAQIPTAHAPPEHAPKALGPKALGPKSTAPKSTAPNALAPNAFALRPRHRARLPIDRATSAGGIVVRPSPDGHQLVLGKRRRERDGVTWTLPKGTPIAGETREETALREVAEETGLDVRILAPVGDVRYWFIQGGRRIHKTVHYFLMETTGGDLAAHDHEFDEVRWVLTVDAEGLMSFPSEREVVALALSMAGSAA